MTLEDRLERLANRTPLGDASDVLDAARIRAETRPESRRPRVLAAAAAVLAIVALAAGGLALAGRSESDSVTVAGPDRADTASEVTIPESGASAQQLADGTPVWVVRHDSGAVTVLDAVSTHRPFGAGTLVGWCESSRGFLDPMYGSQFDEYGRFQAGPAPRGLDSYPVVRVDDNTATVAGPPVEQARAAEGGPEPSEPAGPHCFDQSSGPVDGYLSGPFALHQLDAETPVSPEDAVQQPDGTLVLIDAPILIVEGSQPLVCTSEVGASPPACEGVPAPQMFLPHDETAAVLRGRFIARPDGGTLTDIAYVGERTIADDPAVEDGDGDGALPDLDERGGADGPVLYGPESHLDRAELAKLTGVLGLEDGCLYLQPPPNVRDPLQEPLVWPYGTTWQNDPPGVRLGDSRFLPLGALFTAAGGMHSADRLIDLGHAPTVAERAQNCARGDISEIAYIQGEVTVIDSGASAGVSAADAEAIVSAFLDLANQPSPDAAERLPFADQVQLGLGRDLHQTRSAAELADPSAWSIDEEHFRAATGPFSALDKAAGSQDTVVTVGEHTHCASPPVPPPGDVATLARISVQPDPERIDSCLQWWTVDFFVNATGNIEAVTLDFWEP